MASGSDLEASVTCMDSLLEKGEYSRLREIKTDFDDAVKVMLYLRAVTSMMTIEANREEVLEVCFDICVSHGMLSNALEYALMMNQKKALAHARELFTYCTDLHATPARPCAVVVQESSSWKPVACLNWKFTDQDKELKIRSAMRLQLAYQLAEHRLVPDHAGLLKGLGGEPGDDQGLDIDPALDSILRRDYITQNFDFLAAELDVVAPKTIEDILRSDDGPRATSNLDASRNAVALTYGNAFVHAGYGTGSYGDDSIIQKTRNHGVTSSIACVGILNLWRVEQGLSDLDKYQYSQDNFTRSGALLGFGVCNSGTYNDCDPVLSLVSDSVNCEDQNERIAAYLSLGYAYCATQREDIFNLILPAVLMADVNLEIASAAALALGFIFAGSGNRNLVEILVHSLVERQEALDTIHVYNYALAIGLIYLCVRTTTSDGTMEEGDQETELDTMIAELDHPLSKFISLMVLICRNAGSGNILHCQKCLQICFDQKGPAVNDTPAKPTEEPVPAPKAVDPSESVAKAGAETPAEEEKKDSMGEASAKEEPLKPFTKLVREEIENVTPGLALIGYALIVMSEPIGEEMVLRMINHMLQYDSTVIRRAVPWALAVHSPSSPKPPVVDVLAKLTHDADADTALHAIMAMGVVGAGTNNARVAQVLRSLASFYSVDADGLFLVKLAQGLVHSGKGLHTLSPLHGDKKLMIVNSLAGLVAFAVQGLFTQETLCQGRYHLNLFHLCLGLRPRWLVTVDEEGKPVAVPVRVGQYVDVAGVAGQPRQVAGFRNHNTPILLNGDEKAEMGTAEWQPLASCLEGIVVVRKTDANEIKEANKNLE